MAVSKVIVNGVTKIDVTNDTVAENNLLVGYQATGADGETVIGELERDSALTPAQILVAVQAGWN